MNEIFSQFRDYSIGLKSLSPATVTNYLQRIQLIERRIGKRFDDITEDDLQKYFLELRPIKKLNTIRLEQSAVKVFYRWYCSRYRKPDPSERLRIVHKEYTVPELFTMDELRKMVMACGKNKWGAIRNRAILVLLADTGIRIGELIQLKVGNIHYDPINERFRVNIVGSTKASRQRSFPFCQVRENNIISENWCIYWQAIKYVKNWGLEAPLFQSRAYELSGDGPALSRSVYQTLIPKIVKKAGIEKGIHVHTFRHYYATYCVDNKISLPVLQSRLGHARLESTLVYVHIADGLSKDSLQFNPSKNIKSDIKGFAKAQKEIR
ncbi:MAG: tyrosine-type recombinase/integrase [Candidatus Cloacimonetes bacterium]|nr:tyrosine-type recombinase/integrase [Candidatus Cloacimonadota bacterium]